MKIKMSLGMLICFLITSCSNYQVNLSDYFSAFIMDNEKSISVNSSPEERPEEKLQSVTSLNYYFRLLNNQIAAEEIIEIEEKADFFLNDKIELFKIADSFSDTIFLQTDIDVLSISLSLDSALIKEYEQNQVLTFSDLIPGQNYTLVITFSIARIIHEAKFYIHLKEET